MKNRLTKAFIATIVIGSFLIVIVGFNILIKEGYTTKNLTRIGLTYLATFFTSLQLALTNDEVNNELS